MAMLLYILLLYIPVRPCSCTLCYNGTLSFRQYGEDPLSWPPLFSSARQRARLRCALTVKCDENAMCYVRSWSARGEHAWIVQRGCYSSPPRDPLLQEMLTPTRAMTCKAERLPDAEYKVCLCKADWCNSEKSVKIHTNGPILVLFSVAILLVFRRTLDDV